MVQRPRAPATRVVVLLVLLLSLAAPAAAEQPYPPPPPPEEGRVEVVVAVDDDRVITIEGRGYLADSVVEVQIRTAPSHVVVAAPLDTVGLHARARTAPADIAEVDVAADGTFQVARQLDCEADVDRIMVRVTGTDAAQRPAVVTRNLDVPACASGQSSRIGADGDQAMGVDASAGDAAPVDATRAAGLALLVVVLAGAAGVVVVVARRRAGR